MMFFIRLWEVKDYSIILGRSNKQEIELNTEVVNRDNIPIIKRSSGGGAVLLGPGCLCYTIFLPISHHPKLSSITESNIYIMNQIRSALLPLNKDIALKGHTDLCINNLKFSGNAQRRKRHSILFHGTVLYNFNLSLFSTYLAHPSKEPDYRNKRKHSNFVTNLGSTSDEIIFNLKKNLIF